MIQPVASPAAIAIPACAPTQVALKLGGREGDFDGMSHSGTLLIVRNRGKVVCALPALPLVTMTDPRRRPLPIVRRAPAGMHPGPVMVPVTLAPGAAASTALRWVSGPVFDRSRCFRPTRVTVRIGTRTVSSPIVANVCGEADKAATFDQPPLAIGGDS